MNDIVIDKTNGGLARKNPSGDMISGLLTQGVAVVAGLQLDIVYRLKSVKDATLLGINEAYDETNKILVFEHINEFFRVNPDGDLHVLVVDKTVEISTMVDPLNAGYAKKLLIEAEGKIKQLGVSFDVTLEDIGFVDLTIAIAKAQALVDSEYTLHRPVEVILEGSGFDQTTPLDFRSLNSKGVSVMVGQSLEVANREIESVKYYQKYAAIGTALGAISKAAVNQNIAWVEKFNLYGGSLLSVGISGVAINSVSDSTLETMNDTGAIFFKTHIGRSGIYFNDSHTCIAITDDYAYIENNRTIHKAVRAIRSILLPRLNSPVLVDSDTGKLSPEVIKSYENDGRRALESMLKNDEISALDVFVDPDQNILSTSDLKVQFSLVPTGTARQISVTIGFTNPF